MVDILASQNPILNSDQVPRKTREMSRIKLEISGIKNHVFTVLENFKEVVGLKSNANLKVKA
jgi:hypothetical protein